MRVEFELEPADFRAFSATVWDSRLARSMPSRGRWLVLAALIGVAGVLGTVLTLLTGTAWLEDPVVRWLLGAIAIVFGLLVVVGLFLALLRRFVVSRVPDASVLAWRAIELTDEGVIETTSSGTELTRWPAIIDVSETHGQILLYLSRASAHVIPKRVFASAEEIGRFVEIARSRAGRGADPPPSSALGWSKPAP